MKDPVIVLPYNDSWPDEFKIIGERIRQALGDAAIRIDHVGEHGSWSEQLTLLFRDYLRSHPEACTAYVKEKHRLMELYRNERESYVAGKTPVIWSILQQAHSWSQETGWKPGNSDR
ncbi:hypothetical protein Elgi_41700 [Paenibacillus elgii]|uniref:GrpB family protein n=1 Tax=Paenibacillus elgii TaxID=189691 RepID=UPI002D7D5EC3|nr:hypothetical protein Elgi_41700 [Paenibacillus elgii]